MGIELQGFDELEKKLSDIARRCPEKRDQFLTREAELLKGRAKLHTPVDSGNLRNGWQRTAPHSNGAIDVYNNTDYAAHVEWGHRVVNPKTKKFTGKVTEGAKMLHNAVDETQEGIVSDAKRIFGELLR